MRKTPHSDHILGLSGGCSAHFLSATVKDAISEHKALMFSLIELVDHLLHQIFLVLCRI